jgi:hypothetical protein
MVNLSALLAPPNSVTPNHALDDLIRQDWQSRNLDPTRQITDDDRDQYRALLQSQPTPENDDPSPPLKTMHETA